MYTRLSGFALYLPVLSKSVAFILEACVDQSFLSIPDVFLPLLVVTLFTA